MTIPVLLVEDMKPALELMTETLLLVGGFRVVGSCATESDALHWLEERAGHCQLVLLDLMLREGSGFSVLTQLSRRTGGPQALVFSDFASPAIVDKCRSLGAIDVIPKSDYRQLRTFLENFVRRWRAAAPQAMNDAAITRASLGQ